MEKICPDGSGAGKNAFTCKFKECPDLIYCDANNFCPDNYGCYKLPDNERSYCFRGSAEMACFIKCSSNKCSYLKSLPMQIVCE